MAPKAKVYKIHGNIFGDWEEALDCFLSWKQAEGLKSQTLKDYKEEGYATSCYQRTIATPVKSSSPEGRPFYIC